MRFLATAIFLVLSISPLFAQKLTNERLLRELDEEYGSMAFSADGKILFTAGSGNLIKLRDVKSEKTVASFKEPAGYTFVLQVSPDGKVLAVGTGTSSTDRGASGAIRLLELPSGNLLTVLKGHKKTVRSLVFTPDSKILASGSGDKTINLWEVCTYKNIATLPSEGSLVAISPAGEYLAVVGSNQTIELRNLSTRKMVARLKGHKSKIQTFAFSPDGKTLASGSSWGDTTIRLWNVNTGENIATFHGIEDPVKSVTFSSNGQLIASAKLNGIVELWDVASGKRIDTKHGGIAGSVAFSPDDKILAQVHGISDAGSGIYLWDVKRGNAAAK